VAVQVNLPHPKKANRRSINQGNTPTKTRKIKCSRGFGEPPFTPLPIPHKKLTRMEKNIRTKSDISLKK